MFEELLHSIWDEFSKLVFRAEIEVQPGHGEAAAGNGGGETSTLAYSGGTSEGQPSALAEVAAASGASAVDVASAQAAGPGNGGEVVETVVKSDKENIGRNDPCWCGSGKKYKKCHGA
jgi:preprotein translocase subunit SecA